MALRYLLDSDVIIWHLRGHEPTEAVLRQIGAEQPLACSTLSIFEVWCGVRSQEQVATRRFLEALHQVPPDGTIAMAAADLWREFRDRGVTLGRADALIAATAQTAGLSLVTYNRDHYPMGGVRLYEPMPPS